VPDRNSRKLDDGIQAQQLLDGSCWDFGISPLRGWQLDEVRLGTACPEQFLSFVAKRIVGAWVREDHYRLAVHVT
jgi:hypothetical protein